MSTQQDIYAAGSESRPPMLNKENYVPWSSCLLRYAKRIEGLKLGFRALTGEATGSMIGETTGSEFRIRDLVWPTRVPLRVVIPFISSFGLVIVLPGRVPEPKDEAIMKSSTTNVETSNVEIPSHEEEVFHESSKSFQKESSSFSLDENIQQSSKEVRVPSSNTQSVSNNMIPNVDEPEWSQHVTIVHQTKDLHTADYTQLYDFLKYNQKEVDELKAERLAKTQDPLALMANSNNPYVFPAPHQDQSSFNQNYLQQPMPNLEDITDPTTAMNMALALMSKAFKLNYSTPTNNNQRISSNPRNIVQGNGNQNQIGNGNLVAARVEGNTAGQNGNRIRCYNCRGVGHYAKNYTVRPRRKDDAYLQTQLLIAQKEEAGIQLQAEEYGQMAAAADLDEIEEVNANCILMANLQQASTSGTQTDNAPVYDTDGSAEVHENCDDNEIFNMFTQEDQYTELLEPIPESHQVPQNDNDVISKDTGVEQGRETVEQHSVNFEETRALYESLYQNLAIEVEKVT
nr:hypothetical protein [Tanacetum cinerariifolium]